MSERRHAGAWRQPSNGRRKNWSRVDCRQPGRDGSDALDLGSAYSYVDVERAQIKDFLSRKPAMVRVLKDLAAFLKEKHGVTKSHIEPFVDDHHGCDALVVTPEFLTEDLDEMLEIQGDVLDTFFYPRKLFGHESIALSI